MLLRQIMARDVEVIHPDNTVQEAAEMMKALDIGSLPVCNGRKIEGIITDRDITLRAVSAGSDSNAVTVKEIMTPDLHYCFDDQPVHEAAWIMQRYQIRRLPIVNRNKELVGMVSLGDIATGTENSSLSGSTLEEVSKSDNDADLTARQKRDDWSKSSEQTTVNQQFE